MIVQPFIVAPFVRIASGALEARSEHSAQVGAENGRYLHLMLLKAGTALRVLRKLLPISVAALIGPAAFLAASPSASASATPSIASLALANIGKKACSVNSENAKGFESSCTGNGGRPEYWCADFAKWVWLGAGVADTSQLNALAGSFYTYGQEFGTLTAIPAVGDAAVFNYDGYGDAEHVAIVTEVGTNGTVTTVSGDWNGQPGTEAQFASTSSVVLNTPAYGDVVGTSPPEMGMYLSAFVAPVGVHVVPVVGESLLAAGQALGSGSQLTSPSGRYRLNLQSDGNLVEYGGGRPLWQTATQGHPGDRAVMQSDGNLVVYSSSGAPLWNSGSGGHSGIFTFGLGDDASLVVYGRSGTLWAKRPQTGVLGTGQTLGSGESLESANCLYTLSMQGDGNLVEYTAGRALWATGTNSANGGRAVMQTDGNLVVYSSTDIALWSSGTGGHSGNTSLVLTPDALLVVQGPSGALWTNRL